MSTLFNALQQIEKQAEQETILLPQESVPLDSFKKKVRRPYLKIFAIAFFSICTGLAILGFIWLKSDDLLKAKKWLTSQIGQREEITQVVVPPEKINMMEDPLPVKTAELPAEIRVIEETIIPIEPPLPRPLIAEKEEIPAPAVSEEQTSRIRSKKILYQAENRRIQGDVTAAVKLYRKVWKIDQQPAVANNLAAGLLQLEQHKEAASVLQQALILAPEDPDLLYNLKIANRLSSIE